MDFIQAFPQAPLDDDICICIPQGWELNESTKKLEQVKDDPKFCNKSDYIKLAQNLYGIKQTIKNFYEYVTDGAGSLGFQPSLVHPCLWLRNDAMIYLCVDNCIIHAN